MRRTAEHERTPDSKEKERCVQLAEYLVSHETTVRATAQHFGISKSTVHKDISEKLPQIQHRLYDEARRIMDQNKAERHIRGGQATKNKYSALRREQNRSVY